jgi:tRNA uridine 5-carboxymethylaminomethyl modification enzyme
MYSGEIVGIGPRYCPSIEDKMVRFAEKTRHQIFLEPEGKGSEEIYVNGASTSMPYEIQSEMVHSIIGLEQAELVRPAYAVEYDFAPPTQLHPWLESKVQSNLFFAGQINGTSGYEEAAAQGLVAGINAALRVQGNPPFILRRAEAYIGVLIDDLITKGAPEPYRMFTSRAEHRLFLRHDNADTRLCTHGYCLGLVDRNTMDRVKKKDTEICALIQFLQETYVNGKSLADQIRKPEVTLRDLNHLEIEDAEIAKQAEVRLKYEGFIRRQVQELERFASLESTIIPHTIDYQCIGNLRTEAKQKLSKIRPYTIGQASRIAGVTPADIAVLNIWIRR